MEPTYSAFLGTRRLATGNLETVLRQAWPQRDTSSLLVFDHTTGTQRDLDWRGSADEVVARAIPAPSKPGPGRPRLGVVSTEVTLLPRHWEWLNAQPARASGTLRRLVEEAMAAAAADPRKRLEPLGRILWVLAGNLPGFEEASRALYAGDASLLRTITQPWPEDLPAFIEAWLEGRLT